MRQKKLLSLCTVMAAMFAFAPAASAQEANADVLGLDALSAKNNVTVEQADDGSWIVTTTGSDPFVATTALTRDLTETENTLTFEYKSSDDAQLEFFFSEGAGTSYAGGKSFNLGQAPSATEWTRVNLDITKARTEWEWGKTGSTLRLDAGTDEGLTFQIRDMRVTSEPASNFPGLEVKDGVVQINSQEDFDKWVAGMNGGFISSAFLPTTDVSLNADVSAASTEGRIVHSYDGVFDGNYHVINLDIHVTGVRANFMNYLNGTMKNLYFTGELESDQNFMGTVAMDINATGRVENVHSSVTLISQKNGDGTHGGIAGRILGGVIKNTIYSGKIANPTGLTTWCGGITGWSNSPSTFENVIMIGDISEIGGDLCNAISRDSGNKGTNVVGKNLFALNPMQTIPPTCTPVSEEELASGLVCFLMNGDQKEISWWQTLGTDLIPTFDNRDGSHKQVYAVADLNCDGAILGDATFNNEGGSEVPEHSYVDGTCENCGAEQPGFVELVDGWYVVSTAEQLSYIANFASKNPTINIKIAEDIDMSGYDYSPIMGGYSGTLDGQFHTISNLIINNPETRGQALIAQAGPCTVKNLTLDNTCSITGGGYSAGFIGESTAAGTLTLENLFMHGNVVANGPNAAAIYACNMGTTATSIIMTNCGMSGSVTGQKESGQITGWFGGKATVTNCWAIGTVVGCDADLKAQFSRPGADNGDVYKNCYTIQGSRTGVENISEDAGETGELTWKLNGKSFINPTWFQNLDEGDAYPSLDSSRGIVYPTVDGYTTLFPEDPESFAVFKTSFSEVAAAYLESEEVELYAQPSLVAEYAEVIAAYETANTMEDFATVYQAEQAKKAEIEASIAAYKNYEAEVNAISTTLASRDDFSGDDRDFLEEYISGGLEPGANEKAPNGGFEYIMENRLLTPAQLNDEIALVKELLRLAIANGYAAGTEITDMLVNANFADGMNGWQGSKLTVGTSAREGSNMHGVEGFGANKWHIWQEIIAGKTGVYELKIGGAWRPFNTWAYNSIEYYPYIYINGNANYIQSNIEDYVSKEEAVDGVNCNLNMTLPDLPFVGESGDTLGYVMHGMQSICDALDAGRYDNRILVKANAGDTLKIGVNMPLSEFQAGANEWVGFGDVHLVYHGELEESEEAVNRVLENMLKRANNVMSIQPTYDDTYNKFPNWSQALKDRLAASIEKANNAADVATKYEAIEEMSAEFVEIIDSKKAYRNFFTTVENVYSYAYTAAGIDSNCAELAAQAEAMKTEGMAAYEAGTMTTEEAAECAIAKNLGVIPTIDENGTYHIANTAQYYYFADLVNATSNTDNALVYNAVLDADVCMNTDMIIKYFFGTFDGQDHTLNVDISSDVDGAAPFWELHNGATVKNLIVRGSIYSSNKFAAAIAAHSYNGSNMDRIQSYVNIVGDNGGDGTHGGILAVNNSGVGIISNSLFAGSMSGNTNCNGGIVGWSGSDARAINCLVIANITADPASSNIIGRNYTTAQNCFYVTPYGDAPDGATQITNEDLASGLVAYGLNGGLTRQDVAWRQDLGSDIMPVLDPTHKIVYMTADSTYTNEMQNEIEKYTGTEEDPFILNTAQDMALLRRFLVPGRVNYVKLGADIDMAGITEWYPLNMLEDKANDLGYQNIIDFDGQGHVISNFSCTTEGGSYNSFFGILNGDVRNVGFKDANVVCKNSGTGILAGYMGHDQYQNADATNKAGSLTNVWVTGKLTVESGYAGGMIGNVAGPVTIKNCYTNVEIVANGSNIGGIVGRVRHELNINGAYAAGSITAPNAKPEQVGGIIGGGQQLGTVPGYYNKIAVWNNTDENFGYTKAASAETLPAAADLLDVVFNEDGTVTDQSPMQNEIMAIGQVETKYNEQFATNAYFSKTNENFLKVDYSTNEAMKAALADGYTMETTFALHDDVITETIKPFCATQTGGFGIEINTAANIKHIAYTTIDGKGGYRSSQSTAQTKKGIFYHVVGVYDKVARKVAVYVNGANIGEAAADGELTYPAKEVAQWIGIGADPSGNENVGQSGANFEIINARIYNEPMTETQAKALYFKQHGKDFLAGDKLSNISYYNGSNFAELQGVVVAWGSPWQCDMSEGTYPTFDGTLDTGINGVTNDTKGKIFNINGIQVEKTVKGLYIIDGKKVMVK